MFHGYDTPKEAEADGWVRKPGNAVDVTELPSFGYDWAVKDEDGNIVAWSHSVWISQAKNKGGGVGAMYPMFREEDL